MNETNRRLLMNEEEISRTLSRMAYQVWERNAGSHLALVGVHSRGVPLAQRLQQLLEGIANSEMPVGMLDIGLYRDDLGRAGVAPLLKDTEILFNIDDRNVILVDDVLFTVRTVRAALNALMDRGRPNRVELLVLLDRGHRELPIQADYVGTAIKTRLNEEVRVLLKETDGEEGVYLIQNQT